MSMTAEQVLAAAMQLPQAERAKLASALWESVEEHAELSDDWKAEIKRRLEEIDRGEGTWLTEQEVWERLQKRYGPVES